MLVELDILIFLYLCGVYTCISRGAPPLSLEFGLCCMGNCSAQKKKKKGEKRILRWGWCGPPSRLEERRSRRRTEVERSEDGFDEWGVDCKALARPSRAPGFKKGRKGVASSPSEERHRQHTYAVRHCHRSGRAGFGGKGSVGFGCFCRRRWDHQVCPAFLGMAVGIQEDQGSGWDGCRIICPQGT